MVSLGAKKKGGDGGGDGWLEDFTLYFTLKAGLLKSGRKRTGEWQWESLHRETKLLHLCEFSFPSLSVCVYPI